MLASGIDLPQDVAVAKPSAYFEDGTVGGSTGCNQYTASYTVDGDTLEIGQAVMTMIACPPPADAIERAYIAAFEQVTGWSLDGEELVLADDEDAELLRFEAGTPVGSWEATAFLSGDAVVTPIAGTELTATYGEDDALTGSAGCNRFTGSYSTDGGTIEIGELATTRKLCPEPAGVMEQETAYLAALQSAASFRVNGSALLLLSPDGTNVASFIRASS